MRSKKTGYKYVLRYFLKVRGDEHYKTMHVVQQPQSLGLQVMKDVLLAPQERMTMQTVVDVATLLQQHNE